MAYLGVGLKSVTVSVRAKPQLVRGVRQERVAIGA
jgi:hypothetical protein